MSLSAEPRVRVLLVDDHTLIRRAIAEMIAAEEGIEVVGQAANGSEGVALAGETQPHVVLLDVEMPVMGAEEAISRLTEVAPSAKVIILTMYDEPGLVREFLAHGVSGYLAKTASPEELVSAIRSAAGGDNRVMLSLSRGSLTRSQQEDRAGLSERESEILLFVARGMSNDQIARLLYLTEGTIKRHLHNAYVKLGVSSRGEATRKALAEGWITAREITRSDTP